jgi:hypothetical protein
MMVLSLVSLQTGSTQIYLVMFAIVRIRCNKGMDVAAFYGINGTQLTVSNYQSFVVESYTLNLRL